MNHVEAAKVLSAIESNTPAGCDDERRALFHAVGLLLECALPPQQGECATPPLPDAVQHRCGCWTTVTRTSKPPYPHLVLEPVEGITTANELRTGYVFIRNIATRICGRRYDGQSRIPWIDGLHDYGTLDPLDRVYSVHRIVRAEL